METFGIASVAVITVITYLVGLVGKASSMNDQVDPHPVRGLRRSAGGC